MAGFRNLWLDWLAPWATHRVEIEEAIDLGDRVLVFAEAQATIEGSSAGQAPLPKLTPHSLRRTFCSILYALGESPATVMAEMGHRDPALSLAVYAQAMRRDEHQIAKIRTVVDGVDWANMGERDAEAAAGAAAAAPQSARLQA